MGLHYRSSGATTFVLGIVSALLLILLPACAPQGGEETAPETDTAAAEPDAEPVADSTGEPRVFFVGLEDGETIPPLVTLRFGVENFVIEPVGDGAIHEGAGHYHIGVDTDCLPPGVVIPTADPWIHFGDGSARIEMPFSPGEHRLCLQIGDGEHRTVEGMEAVITVNVVEEEPPDTDA